MNYARLSQQIGRALRRRFVHAQRARTLRRAGKQVSFHHTSSTGRAVYVYVPRPDVVILDYVPSWDAKPYTLEQARTDFLALRAADARRLQETL